MDGARFSDTTEVILNAFENLIDGVVPAAPISPTLDDTLIVAIDSMVLA
jgi:hypothetical protein